VFLKKESVQMNKHMISDAERAMQIALVRFEAIIAKVKNDKKNKDIISFDLRKFNNGAISGCVKATTREHTLWDNIFSVGETLAENVNSETLFAVHGRGESVIKMDREVKRSLSQLENSSVSLWIRPRVYIEAEYGKIQKAYISIHVYVKDERDRWIVAEIPRSKRLFRDVPEYLPFLPAIAFLTYHQHKSENAITVNNEQRGLILLGISIAGNGNVLDLKLPNSEKSTLFFWQIGRFLAPRCWFHIRPSLL
jgi:hypothetical protein